MERSYKMLQNVQMGAPPWCPQTQATIKLACLKQSDLKSS